MKKFISALLAGVIGLSLCVPTFAQTTTEVSPVEAAPAVFKDVDTTTTEGQAIMAMYEKGYLAGYKDGTFRPDGHITRAELVRVINQVMGYEADAEAKVTDFTDNANSEEWFYNDVRIAQQKGYISGFGDNSFRPKENFTRQQACVVLTLITGVPKMEIKVEVSDPVAPWAAEYVNSALVSGLFSLEEGSTFRATQNITRQELCVALYSFVTAKAEETTETTTSVTTETATETTTKSNSASYKSNGGGGGGSSTGSGSGDKTTTTTTVATTETTTVKETATETTTKSTSGTQTKPTTTTTTTKPVTTTTTTTTTEATTEITTATVKVDPALLGSVSYTARNINKYVVPKCSTQAQKDVASAIVSAMNSFLKDNSYDVTADANNAMAMYKSLSAEEKSELKNLILANCSASDLLRLQETFFPGLVY